MEIIYSHPIISMKPFIDFLLPGLFALRNAIHVLFKSHSELLHRCFWNLYQITLYFSEMILFIVISTPLSVAIDIFAHLHCSDVENRLVCRSFMMRMVGTKAK